ncbi:MAG: radical SAM protein [Elusimicrobiota bacterium]|nr:radical SAM protein [Elusimicrobiota bacterium]
MKIAFIKPNIGRMEHSLYVDEARMAPLQFGVLAALTPPSCEVVLHDDRCEKIPYDEHVDLAAITVETYTARRAYEIAAEYGKRGVPVVMGGMHAALLPDEVALHADSVYTGDAEFLWPQLLEDAKQGRLKPFYRGGTDRPQPGLPTRRDIFKGKGYLPITMTQFGRGCRFDCEFCATSVYFNKLHSHRDIKEVVAEIEALNNDIVFFVDDNITADPDAAKRLFRALIPLKIRWISQASLDATRDRELMSLMARSGCIGNVVGFESIDPGSVRSMNKAQNLGGEAGYRTQLEVLKDHGLSTWAAFTLGHDLDTRDTVKRTLEFALENKFAFAAFNILMPYPGTPVYERLRGEGRLLYDGKWWLHPEYRFNHAAFRPRLMTPGELTDACFEARKTFNSVSSIVRRAFSLKTNMGSLFRFLVYARYNKLFRKEVFKKQGMLFGLEGASSPRGGGT